MSSAGNENRLAIHEEASDASGAPDQLTEALHNVFGWSKFRPGQDAVCHRLMQGRSTLAVFPTGGGKSLCYQLPALMLSGLTVVVSPLIALMKDQIDQLSSKNIRAVRLDSSLSLDEYRTSMADIRSGAAKLLYVAPERFFNERFRSSLNGIQISLFAIDEAHCISQWGHNFRPDYLKLARIANDLQVERVLALTATATPSVQKDICEAFEIEGDDVISTPFYRPNLQLRSQVVTRETRPEKLISMLQNSDPGATIVYVTLQKTAVEIAEACQAAGLEARAYHAGLKPELRAQIQEWFMQEDNKIVVATIAFGMGIDKADIRYVYHFNPPKSIENYVQEIGRAGRDGRDSRCELLLVPDDRITLENFAYGDTPSAKAIEKFVTAIDQQPEDFFVSQIKLGNRCDIKSLVVKTLLTRLELDGFLQATATRYDSYQFKPLVPSQEILGNFSGERLEFAKGLLASAKKKSIWFHIDLVETEKRLDCDRQRIVTALDYFAEKGWLELRVSGLMHGYRKQKSLGELAERSREIIQSAVERENSETGRIAQVIQMASAASCQAQEISTHFGQPLQEDCGNCSYCLGDGPFQIPVPEFASLSESLVNEIKNRVLQYPDVLDSPRLVTRFLCGLTSPAITKARLSKDSLFGSCADVPFASVRNQVEALGLTSHR